MPYLFYEACPASEVPSGHKRRVLVDPGFPLRKHPVGRKEGMVYVGFWSDEVESEDSDESPS